MMIENKLAQARIDEVSEAFDAFIQRKDSEKSVATLKRMLVTIAASGGADFQYVLASLKNA